FHHDLVESSDDLARTPARGGGAGPRTDHDSRGPDLSITADTNTGDRCGTTVGTYEKRDSVPTSPSPDAAGAHARGYSCAGALSRARRPSAPAPHSRARRRHGAAAPISARYVGEAPSAIVLLQSSE